MDLESTLDKAQAGGRRHRPVTNQRSLAKKISRSEKSQFWVCFFKTSNAATAEIKIKQATAMC